MKWAVCLHRMGVNKALKQILFFSKSECMIYTRLKEGFNDTVKASLNDKKILPDS